MLKKIASLSFVTLFCVSALSAQDMPNQFMQVINADCNEDNDPFNFDGSTLRTGHLISLSFPEQALKPDLSIANPENPDIKDSVVAVIDRITWNGGPQDNINFTGRLTPQNKAILQEALASLDANTSVQLQLVIYDYDLCAKKYFKRLHTFNKPIQLTLDPESIVYIDEQPDTYRIKKPVNYRFEITLKPTSEPQQIGFAFSSTGKQFSRPVGSNIN